MNDDLLLTLLRLIQPPTEAELITPADSDLAEPITAFSFSGAGTIRVTTVGGDDVIIPDGALAVGQMHPLQIKRVWTTNTTATGIVGYR